MSNNTNLRLERSADYEAVERLTFAAFETMELPGRTHTSEHFLARLLRDDPNFVPELDFVAERDGEIIGNIMYSKCGIIRDDGAVTDALVFGPVSVKPELHGQDVGTLIIKRSFDRAHELDYKAVLITGHPDYYHRFGFVPANKFGLTMINGASFDAFMALELESGYLGTAGGKWKSCKAFDVCENDEVAFQEFHSQFVGKEPFNFA